MKKEDEITLTKKLGYGLTYTLLVAFAILAICALCFIFISITTYFAPPLQPMFDQERLGQLGDFLGGTLNPIFGFATVCLLLWSIYIQKRELTLTRDELGKSADALNKQFDLAEAEYNRKQIESLLKQAKLEYEQTKETSCDPMELQLIQHENKQGITIQVSSLKNLSLEVVKHRNTKTTNLIEKQNGNISNKTKLLLKRNALIIERILMLYIDLIMLTKLHSLESLLKKDVEQFLEETYKLGLIDEKQYAVFHDYLK
ncbi:hypothetical protein [Cellvibrio sp. OA-2007]|uniref:hypothetical protein n=1 Tax=Cellvibrio sp. OA-2007 TaxID=529823 RepID=UPI0007831D1E|nr:hypothetical protein [Cellvibrio sp. OA-2007]